MNIKPIPTKYNGYYFRSRLEARWAVFFGGLNIPYEYEIEGFKSDRGVFYLPDFYLPFANMWIEVKPKWLNYNECEKVSILSHDDNGLCKNNFLILIGDPLGGEVQLALRFRQGWHKGKFHQCPDCGAVLVVSDELPQNIQIGGFNLGYRSCGYVKHDSCIFNNDCECHIALRDWKEIARQYDFTKD